MIFDNNISLCRTIGYMNGTSSSKNVIGPYQSRFFGKVSKIAFKY